MADYNLGTARGKIVIDVDATAVDGANEKVQKFGDDTKKTTSSSFDFSKLAAGFKSVGNDITDVGKGLTKGITAPALIAGGTLAAMTIGPGLKRLTDIDNATHKLEGLGHSSAETQQIMQNALASVKGTAFGLGDAATIAANAVAAGIKPGQDLERTLKLTADAATIAGVPLSDMADIFTDVATNGSVTGETLNRLQERGIPAVQLLAQSLGVSTDAVQTMVTKGQVSFGQFQDAIEKGMGGAALKSGETFQGSLANVQAALGRLGASALSGAFPALQKGFQALIPEIDKLGPTFEKIGAIIAPVITSLIQGIINVVKWVGTLDPSFAVFLASVVGVAAAIGPLLIVIGKMAAGVSAVIAVVKTMSETLKLAQAAQWLLNIAMDANPIGLIITAIAALVAGLIWFFTQTKLGQEIWKNLTDFLVTAWNAVVSFITTTLTAIGSFFTTVWNNIASFVTTVVTNIVSFFMTVFGAISAWWNSLWQGIADFLTPIFAFIGAVIQTYIQIWINIFLVLAAVLVTIWNGIVNVVTTVWNAIVAFLTPIIQGIVDYIVATFTSFVSFWSGVWQGISDFFTGVWNAILAFITPIIVNIVNFITAYITVMQSTWNSIWQAIGSFFQTVWQGIVNFVTPIISTITNVISAGVRAAQSVWNSVWGAVSSFFSGIWNGMVSAVRGAVDLIFGVVGSIQSKIMGFFTGVGTWLYDTGKNIIQGMINGITSMFKNITDAIGKVVNGAIDWAKGVLGIHSPSTVFAAIGVNTIQGMIKGLDEMTPKLNDKMSSLASDMSASMTASITAAPADRVSDAEAGKSQTLNYYNYGNPGMSSEDELFAAMRRARVVAPGW